MTKLHVEYESSESGGERLSDEKWSNYSDRVITFRPTNIFLDSKDKNSWRNEDVNSDEDVVAGDNVYLVVVRYGDGDTFSHSTGNYSFFGIYKCVNKAKKLKEYIVTDAKHNDSQNTIHYKRASVTKWQKESKKNEEKIRALVTAKYLSLYNWRGYFNSLERVEIHPMTVI